MTYIPMTYIYTHTNKMMRDQVKYCSCRDFRSISWIWRTKYHINGGYLPNTRNTAIPLRISVMGIAKATTHAGITHNNQSGKSTTHPLW